MSRKWNMDLLVDLVWTCGQHVLFLNIFVCFCLHQCVHTDHNNLNFLLVTTDLKVTIFQISNIGINAINNQP